MGFTGFLGGKLAAVGIALGALFFGGAFVVTSFMREAYSSFSYVGFAIIIVGLISATYFSRKADHSF